MKNIFYTCVGVKVCVFVCKCMCVCEREGGYVCEINMVIKRIKGKMNRLNKNTIIVND